MPAGPDALDLGRKRCVVRPVETLDARGCLGLVRLPACDPERVVVEIRQWNQRRRVLAGIEAGAGRVAVGVDAVAMEGRAHRCRIGQKPLIKLVNMPVGVAQLATLVVELRRDIVRHVRARVREGEDNRRTAAI